MDNLARKYQPAQPSLEYGRVTSRGDTLSVEVSFGGIEARRAVSCMILPEEGDTVLVSVDADGGAWVLSVLERGSEGPTTMELEGDSVLRVRGGGLTVAPDTQLACVTGKAALHAGEAELAAGEVSFSAHKFSSQVDRVKRVAGMVDDISREFTRRVVNYFRFTSEHEELQAESVRQLVDETLALQSKNTVIMSEEDVKIDGQLIHMG